MFDYCWHSVASVFFFHGDLDMKNDSNIIFITHLGEKKKKIWKKQKNMIA